MLGGGEMSRRWGWKRSPMVEGEIMHQLYTCQESLPSTGSATSSRKPAHLRDSGGIESHLGLT